MMPRRNKGTRNRSKQRKQSCFLCCLCNLLFTFENHAPRGKPLKRERAGGPRGRGGNGRLETSQFSLFPPVKTLKDPGVRIQCYPFPPPTICASKRHNCPP